MKNLLTSLFILFCLSSSYAQLGIKANGTAPIASAQLEVQSTTKAFYPPRMTTAQKNAIVSPQAGAVVYDTDLSGLSLYNGSAWGAVSGSSGLTLPYSQTGNDAGSNGLFKITDNGTNINGRAVSGISNVGFGVIGISTSGAGVQGTSTSSNGVAGSSNSSIGVRGFSETSSGISGSSNTGDGGVFSSTSGRALKTIGRINFSGTGVGTLGTGKVLKSINNSGDAEWSDLLPYSITTGSASKVLEVINTSTGNLSEALYGESKSVGVHGVADNNGLNVFSAAILGENFSTNGTGSGILGSYDAGTGVSGRSISKIGVSGLSSTGTGGSFTSSSGYALTTDNGNVGIGTLTPAAKMDIKGSTYLSHFYYSTNEDTYIRGGKAGSRVLINDIAGMGSVGIGTATPNAKLDIQSSNAYGMIVSQNSGLGAFTAQSNSAATTMLVANTGSGPAIKTIGSIGINTDPTFNLDVSGRIRLRGINSFETAGLWLDGTTIPQTSFIGTYNTSKMGIYGINSGWGFIMDVYDGSVGINTVTPNSKLQVAGSVSLPYTEINTNYTVTDNDYSIRVVLPLAVASPTITLPSPVGRNGRIYVISADFPRRTGVSFEQVSIVDNNGNSLIANSPLVESVTAGVNFNYLLHIQFNNGSTNLAVKRKLSISVQSTGTKWVIIDNDFQY
ncbi:MAG: hypothetical protein V4585_15170 [Bacteroidota bacterium]